MIKDIEDGWKRLQKRPLLTTAILVALVATLAIGAFLKGYFTKWGEDSGSVTPPPATNSQKGASPQQRGSSSIDQRRSRATEASISMIPSATVRRTTTGIEHILHGHGDNGTDLVVAFRNASNDRILISQIRFSQSERVHERCARSVLEEIHTSDLVAAEARAGSSPVTESFRNWAA